LRCFGFMGRTANRRISPWANGYAVRASLRAIALGALVSASFAAVDPARAQDLDIAKEVNCLAVNIYWEAAFEPEAGKYGVAHVTMNRRDDPRWPETVCKVVYEAKAFSWTITHPNRKPKNVKAWEQARIVAKKVFFGLDTSRELWRGVTFYHADYVRDGIQASWRKRLVEYVQVGRHIFYRPPYRAEPAKF